MSLALALVVHRSSPHRTFTRARLATTDKMGASRLILVAVFAAASAAAASAAAPCSFSSIIYPAISFVASSEPWKLRSDDGTLRTQETLLTLPSSFVCISNTSTPDWCAESLMPTSFGTRSASQTLIAGSNSSLFEYVFNTPLGSLVAQGAGDLIATTKLAIVGGSLRYSGAVGTLTISPLPYSNGATLNEFVFEKARAFPFTSLAILNTNQLPWSPVGSVLTTTISPNLSLEDSSPFGTLYGSRTRFSPPPLGGDLFIFDFDTPRGHIIVSGAIFGGKADDAIPSSFVITGGTGDYSGASGIMRSIGLSGGPGGVFVNVFFFTDRPIDTLCSSGEEEADQDGCIARCAIEAERRTASVSGFFHDGFIERAIITNADACIRVCRSNAPLSVRTASPLLLQITPLPWASTVGTQLELLGAAITLGPNGTDSGRLLATRVPVSENSNLVYLDFATSYGHILASGVSTIANLNTDPKSLSVRLAFRNFSIIGGTGIFDGRRGTLSADKNGVVTISFDNIPIVKVITKG